MNHPENEFQYNHIPTAGRSTSPDSITPGQVFKQKLSDACGFHIPKEIVLAAHRKKCAELNIRDYTRNEARRSTLYYENFAIHSDVLIPALRNEIVNNGQLIL